MRSQQEMQGHEARLLKATTEDLRKKIESYAAENGYDMILDVTAVPYAKPALDVTPAILKSMGVDPEKAKDEKNEGK
jgi:Skp family chaperone for outer membrane proteins